MIATQRRFEVKGINDDRDFCECCGKQGLKKVVWIEDTETGDIKHFGVICALKPAKGFGPIEKEMKQAVREWEGKVQQAWLVARRLYRAAGGLFETVYGTNSNGQTIAVESRAVNRPLLESFFKVV